MNILKEDIDKISSNLKIDTDIVNNIINDFDNILQPVIQQNYLSHLTHFLNLIKFKANKYLTFLSNTL